MKPLSKADINPLLISLGVLVVLGSLFWQFATPTLISTYLRNEHVYSVQEAQEYIKGHQYGKVIVVEGEAVSLGKSEFALIDKNAIKSDSGIYPDSVIKIKRTDKMNCYPDHEGHYKIAGAWNPSQHTDIFYGVWVLDGCN